MANAKTKTKKKAPAKKPGSVIKTPVKQLAPEAKQRADEYFGSALPDNTPRIRPLNDLVLVRRDKAKSVTPGGLHLPDTAKEKCRIATVIRVGVGRTLPGGVVVPPEVKPGDRVLFSAYAGDAPRDPLLPEDDGEYLIMREADIFAVVEQE